MLSYKFKNGTVANGTLEQILAMAEILGEKVEGLETIPAGYYHSSSKGLVKISSMHDDHIKNAVTKIAYQYYQALGKEKITIAEYLDKFVKLADDVKLQELFAELQKRAK